MCVEIMLTPVDFHNEMMLKADKIQDETVARCLPPKMKTTLFP